MSVKLLLDENLSPAAAVALRAEGIDAYHVRDRGILGVGDFEKLARARDVHAGIVLIERAGLLRDEQIELVRKAAHELVEHGPMLNEVLRVNDDGSMEFEAMPPANL